LTLLVPGEKLVSASARISALSKTRRVELTRYVGAGFSSEGLSGDGEATASSESLPGSDADAEARVAVASASARVPCAAACSASASSASCLSLCTTICMPPRSRNAAAACEA
jgi:hypothetical protein